MEPFQPAKENDMEYMHWLMENLHLSNTALWNAQMDFRHDMTVEEASRPKEYWTVGAAPLPEWRGIPA